MDQAARASEPATEEVTRLLMEADGGAPLSGERLLPLLYAELHKLATHRMAAERPDHTLQATALVHEAYLRLAGDRVLGWSSRAHFFAAAAEAMRRILIEHARSRLGPKRNNGKERLPLGVLDLAVANDPEQILALDEAISRLELRDADSARVVRLRFYAGLSIEETATLMGISPRTVRRDWAFARAFLFRLLEDC